MTQSDVRRWDLYIDESGKFNDSSDTAIIGAVASCGSDDPVVLARFRETVRRSAPLVPWPFHRWLATKAVMYPLWRQQRPEVDVGDTLEEACRGALAIWEEKCPRTLSNVRDCIDDGDEPSSEDLDKLKTRLKVEANSTWEILEARSQRVCATLGECFRSVASVDGGTEGCESSVVSFLVGESTTGDAEEGEGDRYLNMLTGLLERVGDVFSRLDGQQVITIHPATRWVRHPRIPGRHDLSRAHIKDACERIEHNFEGESESGRRRIRFSIGKIWRYDDKVAPGIVMADSVANYLFREVNHLAEPTSSGDYGDDDELSGLHQCVSDYFGFPMKSGDPKLSHASATGRARAIVNGGRHGSCTTTCAEYDETGWAIQQANQWCDYFHNQGE